MARLANPEIPTLSSAAAAILSRAAPRVLASGTSFLASLPYPLSALARESAEQWRLHDAVALACLQTGDVAGARRAVGALAGRFGADNERIQALAGMVDEVAAGDDRAAVQQVLDHYAATVEADPTNLPVRKRQVALLRSLGRLEDAAVALVDLVEFAQVDAEAWSELADVYLQLGLLPQAIYCLQEVLLIVPNAWNMHARLGEILYMSASQSGGPDQSPVIESVTHAMRQFCRSIELCDDYLRGYYGLKVTTKRLIELLPSHNTSDLRKGGHGELDMPPPPSLDVVRKLHETATKKLVEICQHCTAHDEGWEGYGDDEVKAAKQLLEQERQKIQR